MFALIGRAINRWSFVEEELSHLFMVCMGEVIADPEGGMDYGSAVHSTVFYAVENFRGKLTLIDAALAAYVNWPDVERERIKDDWSRLREKARKLSLRRNKLAHFTVLPGYDLEDRTIPPQLLPPIGSPGYWKETGPRGGRSTILTNHLVHLIRAFCILEERIKEFSFALARDEALFDKYAEQVVRRIRTHSRRDPKRAEVLGRYLSSQG